MFELVFYYRKQRKLIFWYYIIKGCLIIEEIWIKKVFLYYYLENVINLS